MPLSYRTIATPIRVPTIPGGGGLRPIAFPHADRPWLHRARMQPEQYFNERRRDFDPPLIAPCHRVIGAGGSLTGFAGGLSAQQFLRRLENASPQGPMIRELPT